MSGGFHDVCTELARARIEFSVHYVGGRDVDPSPVVTVTPSNQAVDNEQLRTLTGLGAAMGVDGTFYVTTELGSREPEPPEAEGDLGPYRSVIEAALSVYVDECRRDASNELLAARAEQILVDEGFWRVVGSREAE